MKKVPVTIYGGLGEVSLLRKIPLFVNTDLGNSMKLEHLVDVYPEERVRSFPEETLKEISASKLTRPIPSEVIFWLSTRLKNGQIRYSEFGEDFYFSPEDLVDLSVPNRYHFKFLKHFIDNTSANIIVEKPIVTDREQIEQLQGYLSENENKLKGRMIMDAEHYRYYQHINHYLENFPDFINDYGKIRRLFLSLNQTEGFDHERNRNTIYVPKSGGGVWLDLGVHTMAFLTAIGGSFSRDVEVVPSKNADPRISSEEYGETEMHVRGKVYGQNFTQEGAQTRILVGKGVRKEDKRFLIEHERGLVDLDTRRKAMTFYDLPGDTYKETLFEGDPFYGVYTEARDCIFSGRKPKSDVRSSLYTLENLFWLNSCRKPITILPSRKDI
jgi:predicted dehydrogenase